MYQQNMKAVVPILVSTTGYGILLDSYSLMTFHDDAFGSYLWTDVDDELDAQRRIATEVLRQRSKQGFRLRLPFLRLWPIERIVRE